MQEMKDLTRELREFPAAIHAAEIKAEELRESWAVEKVKREYAYAQAFLKHKLTGASVDQSRNLAIQDVYETDLRVVRTESSYRKAAADHMYVENRFQAARKIANLEEAAIMKLGTPIGE